MKCELDYCIYNQKFFCILDSVSINGLGMCDDCIIVSLDEKFLESEKERQLCEIESR